MAGTFYTYFSPRRPSGLYVRDTSDWWARSAGWYGTFIGAVAGSWCYAGVYNNDTIGRMLFLYDVFISSNEGNPAMGGFYQGLDANISPYLADVQALNPNVAPPPGRGIAAHPSTAFQQLVRAAPWGGGNGQGVEWPHSHPYAIIPPGWSFIFQNQVVGNNLFARFGWVALPD